MIRIQEVLRHLSEDAKGDKYWRDKARDVYDEMIKYLKNGGYIRVSRNTSPTEFFCQVKLDDFYSGDSKFSPLLIRFYSRKRNRRKVDARYSPSKSSPVLKLYMLGVDSLLYDNDVYGSENSYDILSSEDFKDDLRKQIVKYLGTASKYYNSFIHEITHHFDFVRSGLSKEEWLNDKSYYRKDKEANAFFQQFLDNLERKIERGDIGEKYFKRWKEDFKEFKDWVFGQKYMEAFDRHLNDDQYQRLVKRLYDFWKKYLQNYEINKED